MHKEFTGVEGRKEKKKEASVYLPNPSILCSMQHKVSFQAEFNKVFISEIKSFDLQGNYRSQWNEGKKLVWIYPTSPLLAGVDTRSVFKRSLTCFFSEIQPFDPQRVYRSRWKGGRKEVNVFTQLLRYDQEATKGQFFIGV